MYLCHVLQYTCIPQTVCVYVRCWFHVELGALLNGGINKKASGAAAG